MCDFIRYWVYREVQDRQGGWIADLLVRGDSMKSQIKTDCLKLMDAIYKDACHRCVAEVSFRDLCTIRSRVEKQGISFLTITLPSFCSDFEKSLELGMVDSKLFRSFRKNRAIPAFLQGMLSHVFDHETGRIISDVQLNPPQISALVASIRQVCLAFKKVEFPCTPKRVCKAVENFAEIERSFGENVVSKEAAQKFGLVSSVLWDNMLHDLRVDMFVPRHGPGATAERISGNQKYSWRYWHTRLEPYFPLVGAGYSETIGELAVSTSDSSFPMSLSEIGVPHGELESVEFVSSDREQPVRVTPVPKTLKGPRIIAIEPCCMQYAQQGIRRALYNLIESHWRTKGHINFRDQSMNQSLAMMSSSDGQLATIDLSDASDRVPRDLALLMFRSNPDLLDAIDACRTTRAQLPNGEIISLQKFASMGSALCFPVEAMYFYTICVMALIEENGLPVSQKSATKVASSIYVYGDDIIVPAHAAITVLDHLRKYNCKVNDRKTFFRGSFRESCGVDAFLGEQVTPVYVGTAPPKNRQQAAECLSWVASARLFFKKGYHMTAQLMYSWVEKVLGPLPTSTDTSPVLGRIDSGVSTQRRRWNRKYHRLEIRGWVSSPVYRTDELDGYGALMKSLLRLEGQRFSDCNEDNSSSETSLLVDILNERLGISQLDPLHLKRSALHGAVALQRRWVPATLAGLGF